jgi:hypothetical protein
VVEHDRSRTGRLRPDGYGIVRLGRRERGFFMDFDRSTVRPSALRTKFAAYVRSRASARAAGEYDAFPCVLLASEHPGGERRAMAALSAIVTARAEPAVFFTTTTLLARSWRPWWPCDAACLGAAAPVHMCRDRCV